MEKVYNSEKSVIWWFVVLHAFAVFFFLPALFVTIPSHIIASILIDNKENKSSISPKKTSYEKWVEDHWNQRKDWPI